MLPRSVPPIPQQNKSLPDMIWDDTEVTPGAAAVDTRMINSCQQS